MRNYIHHILATILFFVGVASIQAQTLEVQSVAKNSGKYDLVLSNGIYHVVSGTQVTVTLNATTPQNTDDKKWTNVEIFNGSTDPSNKLSNSKHTFTPTRSSTENYCAVFTYQMYKNEAGVWVEDGTPQTETVSASVTFNVYNDPQITDLSITPNSFNTYIGASETEFTVNYTPGDKNLKTLVFWQEDSNEPIVKEKDEPYGFTPSDNTSSGTHTIKATIKVYAPDYNPDSKTGTIWWESTESAVINVFPNPKTIVKETDLRDRITLNRSYSYLGQQENGNDIQYNFDVNLSTINGFDNYKWKYIWEFNGNQKGPNDNSDINFANPSVEGTYPIKLTVKAYNPNDNNITENTTPWGEITYTTKSKEDDSNDGKVVQVLPAPKIEFGDTPLSPDNSITYVNGHNVTVTLDVTTNASSVNGYTEKIEWKEGNGTWKENTTGDKDKYIFDPTNKTSSDVTVHAKVSIIGPDEKEWASEERDTTIQVLPNPSSIVDKEKLKANIKVPRKYSYEGQEVEFECNVDLSNVSNINKHKWHYTWSLINSEGASIDPKTVNTEENNYTSRAIFTNPSTKGTYKVKLSIRAYNPDNENNDWGSEIFCDENIVTVRPNPKDVVTEKEILKNITRETSHYSYVGKQSGHRYKVTDLNNDYRWSYEWKLIKTGDENFNSSPTDLKNNNREATFANPDQPGTYKAQLTVTVLNPDANYNDSLWFKQEVTTEDEKSVRVFNEPTISDIKFGDNGTNTPVTYINAETIVEVEVKKDDDIDVSVTEWKTTRGTIKTLGGTKATYTAPETQGEADITAKVSFKVNDETLKEDPAELKNIEIRSMTLRTNKDVTYVGDGNLEISIEGFEDQENFWKDKDKNYSLEINWKSLNVNWDSEKGKWTLTVEDNSIENDSAVITIEAEAKLKYETLPGYRMSIPINSKTLTIYKTPTINEDFSIVGDLTSTCVDHPRILTANFSYTPESLPFKIEWYDGETKIATGGVNERSHEYIPSSIGTPQLSAKLLVCDPNGNEIWKEASSESLEIKVLEKPENAVTQETLNKNVTEMFGQYENKPEMMVGFDGQTSMEFKYKVAALNPDYYWTYSWNLLKGQDVITTKDDDEVSFGTVDFSKGSGTYYVQLTATAYNKQKLDNSEREKWGEQIYMSSPITIYPTPSYSCNDIHKKDSENTDEHKYEYSIYKGEPFDAGKLFTIDENTGYLNGWDKKIYIDDRQDAESDLSYTPDETGKHTLKLVVNNVAPTGEWYDNKVTNGGSDVVYTLYVYDRPTWKTNIKKLFDENSDILHVRSNDNIDFTVSDLEGGDDTKWKITYKVDDDAPQDFAKSEGEEAYIYSFKKENVNVNEQSSNLKIQILNDIDYLVNGLENGEVINKTITVWKEIIPTVVGLTPDDDGNYVLETETREGDPSSGKQEIKITLVGGDPGKWSIDSPTTSPSGNPLKNGYTYTYAITDDKFMADGDNPKTYTYTFNPQYIDGATSVTDKTVTLRVKVWPKPELAQALALSNDNKDVKYLEQSGKYVLTCYENDVLQMTITPTGGNNESGLWTYKAPGMSSEAVLPSDNKITIPQSGTIYFYNYLSENTKKKEVKTIVTNITRETIPSIKTTLPKVDNTNDNIWNAATSQNNAVDLYGGKLPNGSRHVAEFDFSPQSGTGYEDATGNGGWKYSWKVNDEEKSTARGKWNYPAETSSTASNEMKKVSVSIKNSIPAVNGQVGENVGMDQTKTYYVRVWHEAELPNNYSLTDAYNTSNNIKETHAIREGNKLVAQVAPIKYGYSNKHHYDWIGQGSQNQADWENENMTNTNNGDGPGSSSTTYGLHVYNCGPRNNNVWAEKTYEQCKVHIYNHPETPTSLIIKGNGNSGTMIITYSDIMSDAELESRDDYVITFCYTDRNGNLQKTHKPQGGKGEVRWATGFPTDPSQMSNVYAYAEWHYVNQETGNNVLITSGKRALKDAETNLNWDESIYNFSDDTMQAIRVITRSGSGDYTDISSVDSDEILCGEISVYNMNGMMVGTSTKGLTPGIYIIHYQQDGVMKSKKLSVK